MKMTTPEMPKQLRIMKKHLLLRLLHALLVSLSLYCVKITDFCNKPIQAGKEMAGLTKKWHGYKNNWLAAAYHPNRWLMTAAEVPGTCGL